MTFTTASTRTCGCTQRLRNKTPPSGVTSCAAGSTAGSASGRRSSACASLHADVTPADGTPPIVWDEDLGIMTHAIAYDDDTGKEIYDWFDARVVQGSLRVPRLGLMAERHPRATA